MIKRIIYIAMLAFCTMTGPAGAAGSGNTSTTEWDIASTASALVNWTLDHALADRLDIETRILSTREDGVFLDAGSLSGVAVGQVYEVYLAPHDGSRDEVLGEVQVAWRREDYCFAEPRGNLDLSMVTNMHFARLVHHPPALELNSGSSGTGSAPQIDRLLQAILGLLNVRGNTKPVLGRANEPAWHLVITPESNGTLITVTLSNPGGEISGSITLDPLTGNRPTGKAPLDQYYFSGVNNPFLNHIAPPGRRSVKIAAGNIVPGAPEELAILDGSDLWVYDLSQSEPKLVTSHTVSIPSGTVFHREDTGALEIVDLDGDGHAEVCLAPPGASRGEVWTFENDTWLLKKYLQYPPRASDPQNGAVLLAPWKSGSAGLEPSLAMWNFPLTEDESAKAGIGIAASAFESVQLPDDGTSALAMVTTSGKVHIIDGSGSDKTLDGSWGNCISSGMTHDSPVLLLTSTGFTSDRITILSIETQLAVADFGIDTGPVIDLAVGDIDRDGESEILAAVLEPDGVKIYY